MLSIIAVFLLAYAVLFAVVIGTMAVLPPRLFGLAVPAGCFAACLVLAAAVEAFRP